MKRRRKPVEPIDRVGSKKLTPIDRHVATRLLQLRTKLGWTQTALALAIRVSFQQVQKYENGRNRLSVGRLHQLASALKVSPRAFFDGLPEWDSELVETLRAGLRSIRDTNDGGHSMALVMRYEAKKTLELAKEIDGQD